MLQQPRVREFHNSFQHFSTSANSRTWTVIDSNTTLYYGPACVPVGLFALSCPAINPASHSPSLAKVETILYDGEALYGVNVTYGFNGQPVTHTVWFTNATVFCVSPKFDGYELCPVVLSTPSSRQ